MAESATEKMVFISIVMMLTILLSRRQKCVPAGRLKKKESEIINKLIITENICSSQLFPIAT